MAQDLRALASRLVDTSSAVGMTSAFLVESAWGDLLEAISGVSRLQLAAVLTRHRPTLLPSGATGADVAEVVERYRADVVTAGGQSSSGATDDLSTRFAAGVAELRALGDLGVGTGSSVGSGVGSPTPLTAPAPVLDATPLVDSPPAPPPPDLGGPLTGAGSWPQPSVTSTTLPGMAREDPARRAELTRAATAMNALVGKAAHLPSSLASTRAPATTPNRPTPSRPAPKATAPTAKPASARGRMLQAAAILVGAFLVSLVVNSTLGLDETITVAGCVVVSLAAVVVRRRSGGRRFFAALPGPLLLVGLYNLDGQLSEGTAITVGVAGALYTVGFLLIAARAPKSR